MTTFEGSREWPKLECYSDRPLFNTKAVVQQTGIPAPTLRAWERRYALFSPQRADNDYRLYTERDMVLLRWLRGRVEDGMSISQAIALYRHLSQDQAQSLVSKEVLAQVVQGKEQIQEKYFNYPTPHNMLIARDSLIEQFQDLDEQAAHVMMGSLLSLYPIEQVCAELIVPTLWQIGHLWSHGKLTVCAEHFASNFFRSILTNRFHITPGNLQGPLVLVGCAPGEAHELASLMLALFLRLRGLRVSYLGQDIETAGLLATVHKLHPAMLCISLTMPAYISALTDLAHRIHNLPAPRPIFAFGGQAFSEHPEIVTQIPGQYSQGDLRIIADSLYTAVVEQYMKTRE
jgi:DNA-binding transcriptional MerR regulator